MIIVKDIDSNHFKLTSNYSVQIHKLMPSHEAYDLLRDYVLGLLADVYLTLT